MNTLTDIAIREGQAAISTVPSTVSQLQKLNDSSFTYTSLKSIESDFAASVKQSNRTATENTRMTALLSTVRDEVTQAINVLLALKRWVRVQVPKIEDGNNFGVSVQLDTVKVIDELMAPITRSLDDLPSYFEKRALAWDKISHKSSKETKTSRSTSNETGSKEGATSKTSNSESSEEKLSESSYAPDITLHIVALDLKWYVSLHHTVLATRDALMIAADMVDKNMEKLLRPKGTNTHGGGMYAF